MAQESGSTGINRAGKYAGNLAGALLLFALGLMTPAVAQSVQGRIIDESGRPLADVNIFVPGTEAGGKSASDGTFEIGEFVQSGMRLRFSIIGFETQEVVDCIRQGKLESEVMPLDESITLMRTMDTIRKEIGLVYDNDI